MDDSPRTPDGPANAARRVLLVEDDDALRLVTTRMLNRFGFEVVSARDGSEALAHCEANDGEFSLVLADVIMPGIGGVELAQQLSRRVPPIPVILMSGYSANATHVSGAAAVATAFLEKPFTPHRLDAAVRAALGQDPAPQATT